jgi:hypothetical protein
MKSVGCLTVPGACASVVLMLQLLSLCPFPSSFLLFSSHSILVHFSFYYYQNSVTMTTSTAQMSAAAPRVNGSGSRNRLPLSLQRVRRTPAVPSTVTVRPNSNVTMPTRLPIRSVAPARAPNVSLMFAASTPRWPQ